jgi:SanA protein
MLILLLLSSIVLFGLSIFGCHEWIEQRTQDRVYSDINKLPEKKVALLLGTSKFLSDGQINPYFKYRIEAAVQLYNAGKIKHIIVSGDKQRFYNEPIEMMKALVKSEVPENIITLDSAGFRTLDSIIRIKEVFSQNDIIIISQAFHNKRAIFISDFYNIQAIGFNAQDAPSDLGMKTEVREYFARLRAVLDLYILRTQPRVLGEKVDIS